MKTYPWIFFGTVLAAGLSAQPVANPSGPSATPVVAPAATPSLPAPPIPPSAELDAMAVLFDGTTLDNWEFNPANWTIQNGAMHGTGKWCLAFTKQDYASFRLIVTSRVVTPEINNGSAHLGIFILGQSSGPRETIRPKERACSICSRRMVRSGTTAQTKTHPSIISSRKTTTGCAGTIVRRAKSSPISRPERFAWPSTLLNSIRYNHTNPSA